MILDTSVLIELLGNNTSVKENLSTLGEKASTTAITKYELLCGPKEERSLALLDTMEVYDYSGVAAERSAKIYKELRKKGALINVLDVLIASIAIARDELLVTMDKDFKRIEGLKVLVI